MLNKWQACIQAWTSRNFSKQSSPMKSHDQLKGVVKTVIFIISLTVSTGGYGHPLIYAGVLTVIFNSNIYFIGSFNGFLYVPAFFRAFSISSIVTFDGS